jgi:hypothetical protein
MKHYKTPDGQVWAFEEDGSQDQLIKPDMVAITPDALVTLREARRDRKAEARTRIIALEYEQIMPRATREFMLGYMEERATPEQLALLPAYVKLKAFDTQIASLRAIVRGDA